MRQRNDSILKCQCLDFVEATHRHKVYPLMFCQITLDGQIEISRLKTAISFTCKYVPEILYIYDFRRARFIDKGFTVNDIIMIGHHCKAPQWDLGKRPQLQIIVNHAENEFVIGMSHILTDGEGFLQYLYLLASFYNGKQPSFPLENCRSIPSVLKHIHVGRQTEQTRHNKHAAVPPLRSANDGKQYFCLNAQIGSPDFITLHEKAKQSNVTLNDVFITAYARVLARLQGLQRIIIPCPADLRRYFPCREQLSIANMTGIYRRITAEIKPQHSFRETLSQVHIEMKLQKSRDRCLEGIRFLDYAFRKAPHPLVARIIEQYDRVPPVSYTNLGKIDHEKLSFQNCQIKNCFITGTYRLPPDFQLSISTFQNVCTLNCTLIGQNEDKKIGAHILEEVAREILRYLRN